MIARSAIDKANGAPKHRQLRDIAIGMIHDQFESGDRFPSERELMRQFSVSTATVSRAMKSLVAEGILERRVGGGTFVKESGTVELFRAMSDLPVVLINGIDVGTGRLQDPLNWFVKSEIQRGIINSHFGGVRILDVNEIITADKSATAVFIYPMPRELEAIRRFKGDRVVIDEKNRFEPDIDRVTWDGMSGVCRLMNYLIEELGHQKVALISADNAYHRSRISGYRIGLETHGIEFRPDYVRFVETGSVEAGRAAMEELTKLGDDRPTAVFADTDLKARGAVEAALAAGLRVPEDVSIAGFDDIPDGGWTGPALTTVKVPYYELGVEAVKRIRLGSTRTIDCRTLETRLMARESTGRTPIK